MRQLSGQLCPIGQLVYSLVAGDECHIDMYISMVSLNSNTNKAAVSNTMAIRYGIPRQQLNYNLTRVYL